MSVWRTFIVQDLVSFVECGHLFLRSADIGVSFFGLRAAILSAEREVSNTGDLQGFLDRPLIRITRNAQDLKRQ
jgi:hypothetical protein